MTNHLSKTLSAKQLSKRTGIPIWRLKRLRRTGEGPPFFKLGQTVNYVEADVIAWMNAKKQFTTSSKGVTQ